MSSDKPMREPEHGRLDYTAPIGRSGEEGWKMKIRYADGETKTSMDVHELLTDIRTGSGACEVVAIDDAALSALVGEVTTYPVHAHYQPVDEQVIGFRRLNRAWECKNSQLAWRRRWAAKRSR